MKTFNAPPKAIFEKYKGELRTLILFNNVPFVVEH